MCLAHCMFDAKFTMDDSGMMTAIFWHGVHGDMLVVPMAMAYYVWVKMIKWIEEVPVYGFNSSAYDLNVIKQHLHQILTSNRRKYGNISKKEKLWINSVEKELGRKLEENVKIETINSEKSGSLNYS